jgi:hypothetical protein
MVRGVVSIHLRLPEALHRRLKKEARANNVPINTEIVNQLMGRQSVPEILELIKTSAGAAMKAGVDQYLLLGEKPEPKDARAPDVEGTAGKKPG